MMGPQLVTININETDEGNEYVVAKFADNRKLGRKETFEKDIM